MSTELCYSTGSRESPFLPVSGGFWHSWICGCFTPISVSVVTLPSLYQFFLCLPIQRILMIAFRNHWINAEESHLKTLNLILPEKTLLLYKVNISRVQTLGSDIFGSLPRLLQCVNITSPVFLQLLGPWYGTNYPQAINMRVFHFQYSICWVFSILV